MMLKSFIVQDPGGNGLHNPALELGELHVGQKQYMLRNHHTHFKKGGFHREPFSEQFLNDFFLKNII